MKGFFNSFKYAIAGIRMVSQGRNFRFQLLVFVSTIILGLYLGISSLEWCLILLFSALVLGAEALNTAIETLCDLYSREKNTQIGRVKDIAAGAVLIVSVFAFIGGLLIFSKYFF